jgi:hypothetical protein
VNREGQHGQSPLGMVALVGEGNQEAERGNDGSRVARSILEIR